MYNANFQLHEQYQPSGPRPAPKEQIVEVTIENQQKQKLQEWEISRNKYT